MKNVPRLYFFFRFWTFIFVQISKAEIFVEQTLRKTRSLPFCSEMQKITDLGSYHHFSNDRRGGLEDGNGGNGKIAKNRKHFHSTTFVCRQMVTYFV